MPNIWIKYLFQKIKNYCWHLPNSLFYSLRYGFPQRHFFLIGVTGTDGKTTTTVLIDELLNRLGFPSFSINTINSPGLHTTSPHPKNLLPILIKMKKEGKKYAVIETTAHGLDQFRFFGFKFNYGIFTNLSHEHLDDFPSQKEYLEAKLKLLKNSSKIIFNQDDSSAKTIKSIFDSKKLISYSLNTKSDFQAKNLKITPKSLSFLVNQKQIITNSPYQYQAYNILAAYSLLTDLNIDHQLVAKNILEFPETKGRRQNIENDLNIRTIVDFAHTPAALKQTLLSLRETTSGRLIVIFGATGGRDQSKRPLMGEVVSELSDIAFITSDDTRNEKIEDINQQIINGINQSKVKKQLFSYYNVPNRQEAFNQAISLAKPHDTIVACGKGHETTILLGNTEYPWSDAEAFRTAFRLKLNQ
ncbi:MAG TPA: UDP-N-acetylmuramyl-tripeptide synthetase [Candidatus Woesebacteria bacterium]|nr:UDP-N-acetylmuramyl-tripeptide synthetase [Candidatus Woesebacteria bacterium]